MKRLQILLVMLATAFIAGCGGSSDNSLIDPPTAGAGGGDPVDPADITVEMGSGTPPGFTAGTINVAVPVLAAGGSSSLTVTFVTSLGTLYTIPVDVTFSSPCIASSLATISGSTSTTTGVLTVTYAATGCSGDEVITATANIDGILTATGTITVAASTVGSIEFVSVTPTLIGLRGTGGVGIAETSTVVFKVVDATGGPSIGRQVSFAPNTTVGGLTLTPLTAISGNDGRVQTVVQSGTIATSIRVTATVTDVTPFIASQSSELAITTGLPDQNSVSMAVEVHNVEGWNLDGTEDVVTVRLSDRFNNPVPDGTAVTVSTEGGKITGSCTTMTSQTESGFCTVNWISQNPRPTEKLPSRAGRSTIYMTTIGEESFVDVNGSGFFDDGDTFTDLDEPFLDENENGSFDSSEPFFDFNNDQVYTVGDGLFSGLLCGGPDGSADTMGRCAPNATIGISISNLIIMSGSNPVVTILTGSPASAASDTICYWIRDINDQPMPAGTTIAVDEVSNSQIVGPREYVVPSMTDDSQDANTYCFSIQESPLGPPTAGTVFLSIEVPSGLETLFSGPSIVD